MLSHLKSNIISKCTAAMKTIATIDFLKPSQLCVLNQYWWESFGHSYHNICVYCATWDWRYILSWGENSARFVVCASVAERVDVSMWSLNTWLLGCYGRHMFYIMPLRWDSKHSLYCVLEQERRVKVCACVFMRWCSVWRYYRGQIQHMVISAFSFDIHKQIASERLTHAYIPSVM